MKLNNKKAWFVFLYVGGSTLEHYHYPEPHEPHPVSDGPQKRKIDACFALVAGQTKVIPLLHGYGPDDDFHRRVQVVAASQAEGVVRRDASQPACLPSRQPACVRLASLSLPT